jgi:hypothetical protein
MIKLNIRVIVSSALVMAALFGCGQTPVLAPISEPEPEPESDSYQRLHSTYDLMAWLLDPAADHVWDSAGQIITEAETVDLAPTTDEGWDRVRHSAAVVTEVGNLLMLPAHAQDQLDWLEFSRGLSQAGLMAEQAAQAHDADALFDAGGVIYNVCVACHQLYAADLR